METIVFNGREYAQNKEVGLRIKAFDVLGKGVKPHLVSILIGDDPASKLYASLKQKVAERVGTSMEIYEIGLRRDSSYIINLIRYLNTKNDVHGIMVQLPLPKRLKADTQKIIDSIDPQKDVDGLREDSPYVHPTSLAVLEIIKAAKKAVYKPKKTLHPKKLPPPERVCVIGATGMVGRPLVRELKKLGYTVDEVDSKTKKLQDIVRQAKIVVSATGEPGIIRGKTVRKRELIGIDVGAPVGDFNYEEVKKKSVFITPVPGGVGPVTITCLIDNLIAAASAKANQP